MEDLKNQNNFQQTQQQLVQTENLQIKRQLRDALLFYLSSPLVTHYSNLTAEKFSNLTDILLNNLSISNVMTVFNILPLIYSFAF